jgi:hypothetical protein
MLVPLVFLTAGLTLASGGVAVAQSSPDRAPGQTSLTALDADKDGSISRIEATALPSLSADFTLLDQNRNGALEPAEFAQFETLGAETTKGNPAEPPVTPPGTSPPPDSTPPGKVPPPPGDARPTPVPR